MLTHSHLNIQLTFFFATLHVVPNFTFNFLFSSHISSLPDPVGFSFSFLFCSLLFYLSSILPNTKSKCHASSHDRFYQCNMQPLCPNMPLINFEHLTLMSIFFYECKHFIKTWCKPKFSFFEANVSLRICKCDFLYFFNAKCPLQVYHDVNAFYSMQMQIKCKFLFISKLRFSRSLRLKCLQSSIYSFQKSIFFGET